MYQHQERRHIYFTFGDIWDTVYCELVCALKKPLLDKTFSSYNNIICVYNIFNILRDKPTQQTLRFGPIEALHRQHTSL